MESWNLTASKSWDLEAVADVAGVSPTPRMPLLGIPPSAAAARRPGHPAVSGRRGHPAPLVTEKSGNAQIKLSFTEVGLPQQLSPPRMFFVVVFFRSFPVFCYSVMSRTSFKISYWETLQAISVKVTVQSHRK